jgi:isochorismate synthase
MLKELIDRASTCLASGLPFVLYSKPNSGILTAIFQKNDAIHFVADFTETGFVFSPFDINSKSILLIADEIGNTPVSLDSVPLRTDGNNDLLEGSSKEQYLDLVAKAIDEITKGEIDKVVLSRKIEVECKVAPLVLFQRVLKSYPSAFRYLWHHPKIGTWLGATPEILIKSKGSEFTTMSLAGTQNSMEFDKPIWTKKELNEQQMVTDYILDSLKDIAISIETSEVESTKAGHLWHLRTKLKGKFAPNDFGKVLRAIHPTPAVCGTPLNTVKNFIQKNEYYDRSFYTGFLGELNFKSERSRNRNRRNQENSAYRSLIKTSELYVNLRCMQLHLDKATLYVGGGITIDSEPEKEWAETVSKSNTMLHVLRYK